MNAPVLHALFQNAALLLAFVALFDVVTSPRQIEGKPLRLALVGMILGALGIALIQTSFRLESGIVFDTRSVLLALSGLFLGVIPTTVAMIITAAFRLYQGGLAAWAGTAVIFASGGIGLLWRHYRQRDLVRISWAEFYGLGMVVHIIMLALMLTLPWENARGVLLAISLPVLLIFPIATTILGLLLANRIRREDAVLKVAESEARYRSLFELSPEGIVIIEPETACILEFNEVAHRQLGYSRDEFTRLSIADIEVVETPNETRFPIQQVMQGDRSDFETRHRTRSGQIQEVHVTAQSILISGRHVLYSLWHDITERKRAEAALRESEEKFRNVFEFSPIGKSITTLDGVVKVNQALCDMLGYSAQELTGKRWQEITYPEDVQGSQEHVQSLLDGRAKYQRFEKRYIHKTRRIIWTEVIAVLQRDKDQRPAYFLTSVNDITKRKEAETQARLAEAELKRMLVHAEKSRAALLSVIEDQREAEAALRDSEERLRLAGDAARMGIWERQLSSNRIIWSPLMEEIMGYEPGTFPGTDEAFRELIHPDSLAEHAAAQERVRKGDGIFHAELKYRLRDGRERWGLVVGQRYLDAQGQSARIVGVDIDITERKRMEQERLLLETQLRQQQRLESLGTLASGVAHEINNPITGIMNYAQLIQERLPADSPLKEFSGEIMHETQRVAAIVRNLLTFARNEKQSHSPARIADIVEGTLSLIRTVIRHDQITLSVDIPEDLPQLKCRTQQIQQVFMNLVTNARDALNARYPSHHPDKAINLAACLLLREERRWIRVTVEDHGMGITPEVRERMFDPFFTTKPRDQGTGLGLSISHGIVKEHHGEIRVESEPGQFTRIHVDLPVDNGWKI